MIFMRRIVYIFIICLGLFASCSPVKQLNVEKVTLSEFRMESSTKATIVFNFSVENYAQYPVALVSTEKKKKKDLDLFATVLLKDEVSVQPATKESVKVPVEVTLCDPMSLLSMGLNMRNWDINDFVVTGKIVLRGKNGTKVTHKIKDMPMGTLLNRIEK